MCSSLWWVSGLNPSIQRHQNSYPANLWLHFLSLLYFVFIQIPNCFHFIFTITVSYLSLPHQPKLIALLTKVCSFFKVQLKGHLFQKTFPKEVPTRYKHQTLWDRRISLVRCEYEVLNCFQCNFGDLESHLAKFLNDRIFILAFYQLFSTVSGLQYKLIEESTIKEGDLKSNWYHLVETNFHKNVKQLDKSMREFWVRTSKKVYSPLVLPVFQMYNSNFYEYFIFIIYNKSFN